MQNIMLPQASLFIGIIPALILLYISLKGYEGYYQDKTIFLTFIIGVVLGFIAAFVQSLTSFSIVYLVLLAFFDQLFKTIILNVGRLQEKRETTIYGLSLGLGFGSSFTPFFIIAISSLMTSNVYVLLLITIGSFGIILFHAATTAYIGYGIFLGKLTNHVLTAVLLQIPFNIILGVTILYSRPETIQIQLGFVAGLVIYGGIMFWYVTKNILPKILSEHTNRKRSIIKPKKT